jgi:hypothetical protein
VTLTGAQEAFKDIWSSRKATEGLILREFYVPSSGLPGLDIIIDFALVTAVSYWPQLLKVEIAKWAKAVRAASVKAEN